MSKQSWRGSTLLNPEPPVLVSCGGLEQPNLITIGWTGTICTQPSMVSISVRPERYSHHLIKESGQFAINLPTEQLVRAVDWCGVKSGRDSRPRYRRCCRWGTWAFRVWMGSRMTEGLPRALQPYRPAFAAMIKAISELSTGW